MLAPALPQRPAGLLLGSEKRKHQEELDLNSGRGIPRNWIVDGGGKWVWDRQSDFKLDETLPDQILAKMESAKSK